MQPRRHFIYFLIKGKHRSEENGRYRNVNENFS